ncbi:MAG: polysaccharide biosynthesis protein, partial [Candidatus Limnocylindrales bacterium]
AWLILDAAALARAGDLFVLDMGEPVRIMDLALDLVRLAGRDPESQPVEVVGLRPGEKLHEELFYASEQVEPTQNPKVLRAAAALPSPTIRDDVRAMLALATGNNEDLLRNALLKYAWQDSAEAEQALPEPAPTVLELAGVGRAALTSVGASSAPVQAH